MARYMYRQKLCGLLAFAAVAFASCTNDAEPEITPPVPRFIDTTVAPNPVDHRIYADVDPTRNAIWIEWYADTTFSTTGYLLHRSTDSLTGPDGVLRDSILLADFESSNDVLDPLPTEYRDTTDIQYGGIYYYQLRAFHRSRTGVVTYSEPTHPGLLTSFHFGQPIEQVGPAGTVTVPDIGLGFTWHDFSSQPGGSFQVIVQRLDTKEYVWSQKFQEYASYITETYPASAPRLEKNVEYQWRVKRLDDARPGGFSTQWMLFQVQ